MISILARDVNITNIVAIILLLLLSVFAAYGLLVTDHTKFAFSEC